MGLASFAVADSMAEWFEFRLFTGQNKSVWHRYLAEVVVDEDDMLDESSERHQYDEWQDVSEAAVREKIDRVNGGGG